MNAILREKREAPVLTNEAIEVHLSYLRPAVEEVKNELPELRKEMKALDEKLSAKIDKLAEKLDKLAERVLDIQGNQKGLILFLSIVGLLASGISIARTLNWF
jgi:predicted nuclease with TOPRIM domain